jgi:hypothetical protein
MGLFVDDYLSLLTSLDAWFVEDALSIIVVRSSCLTSPVRFSQDRRRHGLHRRRLTAET